MLTNGIFSPIVYGNQFSRFPLQSQCIRNSVLALWREKWDSTIPWMHSSACGSLMLPGGAGLCPTSSGVHSTGERGSQVTDHVWRNKFPNETKLYWKKKKVLREFASSRVTHTWKLKGCACQTREEVNAKENGQRSVGGTKKQCGHERESSFSRASPDHQDLSTSCR